MAMDSQLLFWQKAHNAFTSDRFELTILPTEQCNFRCRYCYEDFAIGRMARPVVDGITRLLRARGPELRSLHIRWFGGEPLLAFDVIEEIGGVARALAETNPELIYTASATTNGSLLELERARRLIAVGVNAFQISLDGPKPFHNTTRITRSGRGSFDRIHANLAALRASDLAFTVELRLHLTPANLPTLDDFVSELRDTYLSDRRFSLEFFPIEKLGGPNDDTFDILDHEEALNAVQRLRRLASPDRPTLADAGERYVCYAAKGNAYVIRANGRLAKCTTALADPRNEIGRLLPDGTIDLDLQRLRGWLVGWGNGNWDALRCPLEFLPPLPAVPQAASL
jgi:uncharacterized protein